jgi:cell division protein FtsB
MGHPVIDEFARSANIQLWFLRNCQRDFPKIYRALEEERDRLVLENAALKTQVASLESELARVNAKRRGATA